MNLLKKKLENELNLFKMANKLIKECIENNIKEMYLQTNTSKEDITFKLKHASNYLKEGKTLRIYMRVKSDIQEPFISCYKQHLVSIADKLNKYGKKELPYLNKVGVFIIVKPIK